MLRTKVIATLGAMGVLLGSSGAASAALVTTAELDGADAQIRGTTANVNFNYGVSPLIEVKNDTGGASGNTRKVYLRFDLTNVNEPSADAASLLVNFSTIGGQTSYRLYALNDGVAGDGPSTGTGWIEGTKNATTASAGEITWANAPGNDTASASGFDAATTTFLGTFTPANGANTITQASLTGGSGTLLGVVTADTNDRITFMISGNNAHGGGQAQIHSGEAANASFHPALSIVPEPAAAGLFAAAAPLLLARRRRDACADQAI